MSNKEGFSSNQAKIIALLRRKNGKQASLHDLAVAVYGKDETAWPKNWQVSLNMTMRALRLKMIEAGGPVITNKGSRGRGRRSSFAIVEPKGVKA